MAETLHRTTLVDVASTMARVLCTTKQMLRERGCEEVDGVDTWEALQEVPSGDAAIVAGPTPSTGVYFPMEERVAVKTLRTLLETSPHDKIVVVTLSGPTSFTRKEAGNDARVQFFRYRELSYNVTRHMLVPRHWRDTGPREHASDAYPKLLASDPVALYYDFRPGELVAIEFRMGGSEVVVRRHLVVRE
jgi:DNA-directed RNA polymerase subunit H (RpoH/RPB5)